MKNFSEINRALVAKKKIFTLFAAMLLSVTAMNAVEVTFTQEISLGGFSPWTGQGTYNTETKVFSPSCTYGGGGIWLDSYDASAYKQIVLELASACSQQVSFAVDYTDGDGTAHQGIIIPAGATSGTMDLTGSELKSVTIQLNSNTYEDVTIALSRVYLVGTRIKKAALVTLDDTETEIESWDKDLQNYDLSGAHEGDQVIINFAKATGGKWASQIQVTSNGLHLESVPTEFNLDAAATNFRFSLTEADAENVKTHGIKIAGYYITISSIQLQKYAVIKDTENAFAADWSSGAFQVADNDMPTLEDGDSLCVEVKEAVEGGQILLQHTTDTEWTNFSPAFNYVFSEEDVAAMPKTIYLKFTTARITDLGSYKLCVNGNNFTLAKAYIIKGTPDQGGATAIDQVSQSQGQSQKLIKDGQLFIIRDNKTYTLQGQLVK